MRSNAEGILGLTSRREKKGITLEEISKSTKIGVRSLQAIEAGEFQKLPGGIYSTSYIRQYAKAIDCDESQILAEYYSVMGIGPEPENPFEKSGHADRNLVSRVLRHTSAVLSSL
jgi:cytoskeleton protein RodZ